MNILTKNKESQSKLDWDFYLFVGNTLLGWSMDDFFNVTPNHLLKQFIMWLKYNNPKALKEDTKSEQIYTLDQTPFL